MSHYISAVVGLLCCGAGIYEYTSPDVSKSSSNTTITLCLSLAFTLSFLFVSKSVKSYQTSMTRPYFGYDVGCIISLLVLIISIILLTIETTSIPISIILISLSTICLCYSIYKSLQYRQYVTGNNKWLETTPNMNAIVIKSFGKVDDIVSKVSNRPRPRLGFTPNGLPIELNNDECQLLIKVFSCSLSPSDYRMWSGAASLVKYPSYGFPYIPLGDMCGQIIDIYNKNGENTSELFKIGDVIVSTWDDYGINCLADYAVISSKCATVRPNTINSIDACALANSSVIAYDTVTSADIQENDRILILGASGGMGTSIIQFIRNIAPNCYIAATSTDQELVKNILKVDRYINYEKENWWECEEFKNNNKFDKVFDCAEGCTAFYKGIENGIIKNNDNGGVWYAVVINDWHIDVDSVGNMFRTFLGPFLKRMILNKFRSSTEPRYEAIFPNVSSEKLNNILNIHSKGEFNVIIDSEGPFEFTEEGVKRAFNKHQNRKGHGKIVIKVADE